MSTSDTPTTERDGLLDRFRRVVPGLATAVLATAVALGVNTVLPTISALTVAVVLGVLAAPLIPDRAREGLRWGTRIFLRLGVVLLGLQLALGEVLALGPATVLVVVAVVVLAFAGTLLLGRLMGVSRGLGLLVATGFSICGASAIAAMGSVTESEKEDVATAVTLVTLYGSAAIALVPLIGSTLGMSDHQLGAWAGLSVHEVAQVVAAASPAGAAAVAVAVVVKLTRVLLLAPMVAGVGLLDRWRGTPVEGKRPPIVPLFVAGFLAMIAVRSTGVVPETVVSFVGTLTTLLFAAALFGLGSGVRIVKLLQTGKRGLALGALSTLLVGSISLVAMSIGGIS